MKVLLAGAFGNLGFEILKCLTSEGYEVIAADLKEKENNGLEGKYTFRSIDATNPKTLEGLCDGCEIVITTMGLTGASTKFTAYDIDYQGNMNLYNEAVKAGVKKFNYISVIACDEPGAEKVPLLHSKYMVEEDLKKGPLDYVIYRPTGYFYDIAKVFKPYIDKGEMQLLKGYHHVKANVVDCPDFAKFMAGKKPTAMRRWQRCASVQPANRSSSRTVRSGCSRFLPTSLKSKKQASMTSSSSRSGHCRMTLSGKMSQAMHPSPNISKNTSEARHNVPS